MNYRAPKKRVSAAKTPTQGSAVKKVDDWRLYDLSVDIGEKSDIADAHPDVVQKMLDMLKSDGLL